MPTPRFGGTTSWCRVRDGALAIEAVGAGPLVVLLHGWTLDRRMWVPQVVALADRFRVVAIDRRGFGQSGAPGDLDREWQDIGAIVGDARFALVGLSQGAAVALDFARRCPDNLAALVLAGTPLHGVAGIAADDENLPRDLYAAQVASGGLAEMKAHWRAHRLVQVSADGRALLDPMLADYEGRDLRSGRHAMRFAASDLAGLPMPVLALTGEHDSGFRRSGSALIGATAPRGESALLSGAGHLCNLDDAPTFNAVVGAFLDRHHR